LFASLIARPVMIARLTKETNCLAGILPRFSSSISSKLLLS
jgi:hypothetical protein